MLAVALCARLTSRPHGRCRFLLQPSGPSLLLAPRLHRETFHETAIHSEEASEVATQSAQKGQVAHESGKQARPNKRKGRVSLPEYEEKTPKGSKKVLGPLDSPYHKVYHPSVVESAWGDWWEKEGFFKPQFAPNGDTLPPGAFVVPIPPPNVTGALHCGHALGTALQDVLVRWHRMRGFTTLYLPGCDHASISTQSVVEKMMWKKERKTRHDVGDAQFLKRAFAWKDEYQAKIKTGLRRLGGSFDWSRERFTMDPGFTEAVVEAFVRLHDEGYIYRARAFVNYSVHLRTSVSNLEVDTRELNGRTLLTLPGYDQKVEFGVLTYFKYPIDGSEETIEVATTRLETMLGDSGIAVHPDDARHKHLVGKCARHPFVDRLLPIVADDSVDPDIGTGAVKITPAHDVKDHALGARHKLDSIDVISSEGTMLESAGKFGGKKRYEARHLVRLDLERLGLFVKKVEKPMTLRLCSKSKDVIEPLLRWQWWMRMPGLAAPAVAAVRDGDIKLWPEAAEKDYYRWLESINDWCLSRQILWGQRIPAYRVEFCGPGTSAGGADDQADRWVVARSAAEAREKAAQRFPRREFTLQQDKDVLDTWFSSALWPFAALGWPKETHDYQKLFPTSVLETGWDILFFWVARMIMLSLKLTGQVPFREVFAHSLVRDSQGRKMSKSLGNIIDPVDVIDGVTLETLQEKLEAGNLDEKQYKTAKRNQQASFPHGLPECGVDALRFSLIKHATAGGDFSFDVKQVEVVRRFCNKVYQATRFTLGHLATSDFVPGPAVKTGNESLAEHWILDRLNHTARDVNAALEQREFARASQVIYKYWRNQLCDVYIESVKALITEGSEEQGTSALHTLYWAVEGGLALLHPFMPFLTEELWQRLPRRPDSPLASIVLAPYPAHREDLETSEAAKHFDLLLSCAGALRSMAETDRKFEGTGQKRKAYIHTSLPTTRSLISLQLPLLRSLLGTTNLNVQILPFKSALPLGCALHAITPSVTVYVEASGDQLEWTHRRLAASRAELDKVRAWVHDEAWVSKASGAVVEQEREMLRELEARVGSLEMSVQQMEQLVREDARGCK